jgi:hypothetical protein
LRGQCVQDRGLFLCLAVTQLFLGATQQERPAVTVRHRIDFAFRQFFQALLGFMQRID